MEVQEVSKVSAHWIKLLRLCSFVFFDLHVHSFFPLSKWRRITQAPSEHYQNLYLFQGHTTLLTGKTGLVNGVGLGDS